MAKLDFSALNKAATKSFNEQRNVIKKIGKGETVRCQTCGSALVLTVSETQTPGVRCDTGCTNIMLEVE